MPTQKENTATYGKLIASLKEALGSDNKEAAQKALAELEAHQQKMVDSVNRSGQQEPAKQVDEKATPRSGAVQDLSKSPQSVTPGAKPAGS